MARKRDGDNERERIDIGSPGRLDRSEKVVNNDDASLDAGSIAEVSSSDNNEPTEQASNTKADRMQVDPENRRQEQSPSTSEGDNALPTIPPVTSAKLRENKWESVSNPAVQLEGINFK